MYLNAQWVFSLFIFPFKSFVIFNITQKPFNPNFVQLFILNQLYHTNSTANDSLNLKTEHD